MPVKVSLHRFRDCAALSVLGVGGATVYVDAKGARALARDMARLARSLENERFVDSEYRQEPVAAYLSGTIPN